MIIVGLEGCESCKILRAKYPNMKYVEIPRKVGISTGQLHEIKKMIGKSGLNQFPMLIEDDLSGFIPMVVLDEEFAKEYVLLY